MKIIVDSNVGNVVSFHGADISVVTTLLLQAIVLRLMQFLKKIINSNFIQIRHSKILYFVFSYAYRREE